MTEIVVSVLEQAIADKKAEQEKEGAGENKGAGNKTGKGYFAGSRSRITKGAGT